MINKDDEDILSIMLSASKILIWKKQMIRITKLPGGWSVLDVILFYYKFYMDLMSRVGFVIVLKSPQFSSRVISALGGRAFLGSSFARVN